MSKVTTQDIEYRELIQQFSSSSIGKEEIDIMDINKPLLSTGELKRLYPYRISLPKFETDLSSIQSYFEIKNETSFIEEPSEIAISEDMLEFDIVVRMPPKKEWSLRLRVESVEKAKPHIVEPESF